MKKTAIIFGIIAGIVPSAMFFIVYREGMQHTDIDKGTSMVIGYLSMIVGFIAIFFATRQHRDKNLGGKITFGKALLLGLFVSLVASVVYSTSWEIYLATNDFDFGQYYVEYQKQALEKEGKTPEEIQTVMAENASMMEMYDKNLLFRFVITMSEILPVGIVVSLISALVFGVILKPKNPVGESA